MFTGKLVRNWGAGLSTAYVAADYGVGMDLWPSAGFTDVTTIQGRTIAMIPEVFPNWPWNSSSSYGQVVELRENGLHVLLNISKFQCSLLPDGSLRTIVSTMLGDPNAPSHYWQEVWEAKLTLTGDDISWELPGTLLVSFNTTHATLKSQGSMSQAKAPSTGSGNIVIFDASSGKPNKGVPDAAKCRNGCNSANHVGVIASGASKFTWQAAPFGEWNASYSDWRIFQPGNVSMKVMEIHDPAGVWGGADKGVGFAGSIAMTLGEVIIIGFYGEGWMGCEANQFLHFHAETGVYLGQFGTPNCFERRDDAQQYAVAGAAGNAFSPTLVQGASGDDAYLWHQDESGHGGMQRWHLTGLDSVVELAVETELF